MILKGSQRGGPRQLAAHLLNVKENDHVLVQELRGFVSEGLYGAMAETVAISRGTKCRQPIFSLSLNPPRDAQASLSDLTAAVDRAEVVLGLVGQPRVIVIHEKEGRRHAHAVWSRIDPEAMKAINLPYFKNRLTELSKELYLENGWALPEGHRTNDWKNPLNFTLAEWQQAKRAGLDPREVKQIFKEAWERSDNLATFRHALEERGYYLAKGRRIVATDLFGEVLSVARWTGVKTEDLTQRFGRKGDNLPSLSEVRDDLRKKEYEGLREHVAAFKENHKTQLQPHKDRLKEIAIQQRRERILLAKAQAQRWRKESKERANRFRRGLGIVLDVLTGNLFKQRKRNDAEAYAAFVRDRKQREALFDEQAKERAPVQAKINALRSRQRDERRAMAARVHEVLSRVRQPQKQNEPTPRNRDLDLSL